MPDINLLKQLRDETGISMMECKKALDEAKNDLKRAKEILREKGKEMVKGREGRTAAKGLIESYVHSGGRIGVLLQLNCETDFVAKSEAFVNLAHELCLQIAAARPLFVKASDVAEDFLASERKIYQKQFEESGKPQDIMNKIIQGKLDKYQQEVSLLSQPWVKDPSKNMQGLLEEVRAKTGENIEVVKFARFEI
ncbi:elongation factor Ts [bacterium (Candidatus Gribaldobacteria) CG_4_8_14_3_um_filter_42_11]|uniref:Elongation factor Ts n=3 Tax=Candidatus Gribaldobacteria TaxID=2798536 RepID=A0A2H0UY41_9BACT|nr:MAG: elongation factor Ts [Parcubacteria group bacterium CG1_02_41_26]PIR91764.1 MAG: elongation factor Ts [bacterium (Candidatus Gribaldobacteria) CG10_big_fil_rev_8_21_14_0_10_41_12]PIV46782.1 MAG: elongation factor Ts [bacterium (Candidatus Gribaldobacteria) CG02_land_8_20_14_3_00_41_15]PIX03218.1 MAG: elongation factor Ts [bacterium (Candidatus Gribaldobacteria) CG_4_8_14_3_um_filter_42_11]